MCLTETCSKRIWRQNLPAPKLLYRVFHPVPNLVV
uniref:Uncharacterized protein n=1 Tax=Arundo donax TaxID=35708 RepID=A0A0A9E1B3_ARUDO